MGAIGVKTTSKYEFKMVLREGKHAIFGHNFELFFQTEGNAPDLPNVLTWMINTKQSFDSILVLSSDFGECDIKGVQEQLDNYRRSHSSSK